MHTAVAVAVAVAAKSPFHSLAVLVDAHGIQHWVCNCQVLKQHIVDTAGLVVFEFYVAPKHGFICLAVPKRDVGKISV